MKLKYLNIALSSEDYKIKNPPGSEFPFKIDSIVADFNFQVHYFSQYLERSLRELKYESKDFNMVLIRGRKNPKEKPFIDKHYKSLTIEVNFDEIEYKKIYPYLNIYPIGNLLIPLNNEVSFSLMLKKMLFEGIQKVEKLKVDFPVNFISESVKNFELNNFRNEWLFKKKIIKKEEVKYSKLICKITPNYFALNLLIENAKGDELYRKELLKTLPSFIQYKHLFSDLKVIENKIIITNKTNEDSLFVFDLKKLKIKPS